MRLLCVAIAIASAAFLLTIAGESQPGPSVGRQIESSGTNSILDEIYGELLHATKCLGHIS